jgi:phosphoglycerate dehydrogenase-like enzyme
MRIHLVGEAADHEAELRQHLQTAFDLVALPADAASTSRYDETIEPDDIVVSLRFGRPGGQAPPFRLLHVPGAGLDGIDLDALHPSTAVANVYEHEGPIAEFVLARLLEWEIRAGEMQSRFTPRTWPDLYRGRTPHGEIRGRTLGIVGYGRIGRAIAARASGFETRILAADDVAGPDGVAQVLPTDQLDKVLAEADYLVLACPLTPATTGLIDRAALARMRAHAVLVNVARGPVVDQAALYEALRDGVIGGAVLDVWYAYPRSADDHPAPASHPFWELPNAWCTPHSCAWTRELPARRYRVVAENVDRLASGQPLTNLVRAGKSSATAPPPRRERT